MVSDIPAGDGKTANFFYSGTKIKMPTRTLLWNSDNKIKCHWTYNCVDIRCEKNATCMLGWPLKGQCQKTFDFRFSTWINFPQAPDYTIRWRGAVSNFSRKKIRGDIRSSRCTTGVVDTGGAPWLANISANFRKIRNDFSVIFRLGDEDSWKKSDAKNRKTISL